MADTYLFFRLLLTFYCKWKFPQFNCNKQRSLLQYNTENQLCVLRNRFIVLLYGIHEYLTSICYLHLKQYVIMHLFFFVWKNMQGFIPCQRVHWLTRYIITNCFICILIWYLNDLWVLLYTKLLQCCWFVQKEYSTYCK